VTRAEEAAMDAWLRLFANRDEVADEYARWILNGFTDDWSQFNHAIIRRWSKSGLLYIKRRAWAIARDNEDPAVLPVPEEER